MSWGILVLMEVGEANRTTTARGVDPGGFDAWSLALLVMTIAVLLAAVLLQGAPPGEIAVATWMVMTAVLGGVIVNRAGNRIGWLMQIAVAVGGLGGLAEALTADAVASGRQGPFVLATAWFAHWVRIPALGAFVFLFLLFPTGRLPGPRWSIVAWGAGIGIALISIGVALTPGPMAGQPAITNPLGIERAGPILELVETIGSFLLAAGLLAAVASLIVRLRRSQKDERAQLKWLLFAASLLVVTGLFAMVTEGPLNELSFVALLGGLFALPVALTIALTRYHLYDIDLVINRTILYAVMSLIVIVLYILIVGVTGSLLQRRVGLVPALVATGIVAVLFQPLRRVLQDAVDRLMYGERRDPYRALTGLASRLESTFDPEQVLPAIVETVASSLKLSFVAIESERDGNYEVVASTGSQTDGKGESLSLVYQGAEVGRLLVVPRKGDVLTPTDRALLTDLARNAGAAVHAVALTEALRRSRNDLLATREEERRRLRRDLHDGLGPELAGIALGVGAARNLSQSDASAARSLLDRLQEQADAATKSIRGLVDGLRPASLDDLGLVEAVREKATALLEGSEIGFQMVGPAELGRLPAAVEVAALRITLEAVTNVVRHSHARLCRIEFMLSDELVIQVADDGRGFGRRPGGVGLVSMRERAEEVGGSLTVESSPDAGTRVIARLPLR